MLVFSALVLVFIAQYGQAGNFFGKKQPLAKQSLEQIIDAEWMAFQSEVRPLLERKFFLIVLVTSLLWNDDSSDDKLERATETLSALGMPITKEELEHTIASSPPELEEKGSTTKLKKISKYSFDQRMMTVPPPMRIYFTDIAGNRGNGTKVPYGAVMVRFLREQLFAGDKEMEMKLKAYLLVTVRARFEKLFKTITRAKNKTPLEQLEMAYLYGKGGNGKAIAKAVAKAGGGVAAVGAGIAAGYAAVNAYNNDKWPLGRASSATPEPKTELDFEEKDATDEVIAASTVDGANSSTNLPIWIIAIVVLVIVFGVATSIYFWWNNREHLESANAKVEKVEGKKSKTRSLSKGKKKAIKSKTISDSEVDKTKSSSGQPKQPDGSSSSASDTLSKRPSKKNDNVPASKKHGNELPIPSKLLSQPNQPSTGVPLSGQQLYSDTRRTLSHSE